MVDSLTNTIFYLYLGTVIINLIEFHDEEVMNLVKEQLPEDTSLFEIEIFILILSSLGPIIWL